MFILYIFIFLVISIFVNFCISFLSYLHLLFLSIFYSVLCILMIFMCVLKPVELEIGQILLCKYPCKAEGEARW